MRKPVGSRTRQTGAATLLVSMVLLIAGTLLVLYASNAIVGEQRMSANEMRSKQAFEAAAAGIELTVERINADDDNRFDATLQAAVNGNWTPANSSYQVMFCDASTFPAATQCADLAANGITPACTAPASTATIAWVVSCGWSDDSAARKRVISLVSKTDPVPGNITNPLTAKGAVAMSGNATVVNYYNNLTVWTGDTLDNTGNTGKTVIRRPSSPAGVLTSNQVAAQVGGGNQVCNVAQAPDLICTTSTGVFGPDVIQSDSSLANLSDEQYFENFLGMPPNEYKATMAEEVVAGADASTYAWEGDMVYWVEGNASINDDIGTLADPVVLIVDGDLDLSGGPTIFGVVFVRGALTQSGTATIRGAVLVTGEVDANGTLNVIYDPEAIGGTGGIGAAASVPGTWRDF